jgi:hypothetical protein
MDLVRRESRAVFRSRTEFRRQDCDVDNATEDFA